MWGFHMKVLVETPGLYQVPKLRNATTTTATTATTATTTTTTTWVHGGVPYEGPRENPKSLSSPKSEKCHYYYCYYYHLGSWGVPYEGSHKNPRSLSSPKAE